MSRKHKGSDSILYDAALGSLKTSGDLTPGQWYRIKARATVGSALPDMDDDSIFQTPEFYADKITLAVGDEVYPLTLTLICKVDVNINADMGTIDTTDSCDFPYTANLPDGLTNISGSIGTMLRFDSETDELVDVSKNYLNKFWDIVEDDGAGTYTITSKDDSDILLMVLLNSESLSDNTIKQNWLITPAILNSIAQNIPLKDVMKADYNWVKGQGPASVYIKTVPAAS